jgi:hypothetical protein
MFFSTAQQKIIDDFLKIDFSQEVADQSHQSTHWQTALRLMQSHQIVRLCIDNGWREFIWFNQYTHESLIQWWRSYQHVTWDTANADCYKGYILDVEEDDMGYFVAQHVLHTGQFPIIHLDMDEVNPDDPNTFLTLNKSSEKIMHGGAILMSFNDDDLADT